MTDTKLAKALWDGHVPVCFNIDASEITTLQVPRPYYAMVPRVSSVMCATTDAVINHFKDVAPPTLSSQLSRFVWFEFKGMPLKWQLPFGVLYDLHGDGMLPWAITVHFQGYPSQHLLPCDNLQAVEMHFMNCYKQSMFLLFGSTKWIMNLPQQKHTQLWKSLVKNDFAMYQAVHGAVVPATEPRRHIPLRVLLPHEATIQLPLPSSLETIRSALVYLLPQVDIDAAAVRVHGIDVELDLSISELYRHFAYPDGFLYIAVLA